MLRELCGCFSVLNRKFLNVTLSPKQIVSIYWCKIEFKLKVERKIINSRVWFFSFCEKHSSWQDRQFYGCVWKRCTQTLLLVRRGQHKSRYPVESKFFALLAVGWLLEPIDICLKQICIFPGFVVLHGMGSKWWNAGHMFPKWEVLRLMADRGKWLERLFATRSRSQTRFISLVFL